MIAGVVAPDVIHLSLKGKELAFFVCIGAAFLCVIFGNRRIGRAVGRAADGFARRTTAEAPIGPAYLQPCRFASFWLKDFVYFPWTSIVP